WIRDVAPELTEPFDLLLPISGELELPDGRVLRTTLQDEQEGESQHVVEFSFANLPQSLRVRSWQAGDRFEPQGMAGHKKMKRFFADCRTELEERRRIPLLIGEEKILWVIGERRSRHAVAGHDRGRILRVELI
ncbi:MAG: tRNA lysidine(34) synthetase TilS, partial [Thermodesulfobacteriota bacterium]|nr:tRNA lysidine(34) synthetase TilS [Thermodesulfobacteriota bacterium]